VYNSYRRFSAFLYKLPVLSSALQELQRQLEFALQPPRLRAVKVTFRFPISIGKPLALTPFFSPLCGIY
jgi:hypothetical protein